MPDNLLFTIGYNLTMKMPLLKTVLLFFLVAAFTNVPRVAKGEDDSAGLTVQIDFPVQGVSPKILPPPTLLKSETGSRLTVTLTNTSAQKIILVKGNGVLITLHFEVTDEDGKTTEVEQSLPVWSAYIMQKLALGPGDSTTVTLHHISDLPDREWGEPHNAMPRDCNECVWAFPFPRSGESRNVTLRAVFENVDGGDEQLWHGKAVSAPCGVILKNDL